MCSMPAQTSTAPSLSAAALQLWSESRLAPTVAAAKCIVRFSALAATLSSVVIVLGDVGP
jgi:hypothetical protein